ncbi:DUF4303 domain-containing protein [Microbacterium sp. NPDC057650]|uniref:DUF4303 domain-containing protein n=1 Tax=unclassified Microbacterium TaxID=2609290 RepID=UPI00366A75FA
MTIDLESWAAEWSSDLGPALEQAMAAVAAQRRPGEIAGIGIATDADATSIVAFANSRSHLAQMIADEPEYEIDSKWHLGEWDLDITGRGVDDPLDPIRERAAQMMGQVSQSDAASPLVQELRLTIWQAISRAMVASAARGYFDAWPNAVRVFLPLDADVPEQQIAAWNTGIHDSSQHEEFRGFLLLDGE